MKFNAIIDFIKTSIAGDQTLKQTDILIIGASIAGCAAAILYAEQGLQVYLIDKNNTLNAFKKICTHTLQSCAIPILQELNIFETLIENGAILTHHQIHTPAGLIQRSLSSQNEHNKGINVTRQTLDPIIRNRAMTHRNIHFIEGYHLENIQHENEQVIADLIQKDNTLRVQASLLVGADGKNSTVAKLAAVHEQHNENNRFGYYAYFTEKQRANIHTELWYLDPSIVYRFPNENNLTVLGAVIHHNQLAQFNENREQYFEQLLKQTDIDLRQYQLASKFYHIKQMPNIFRHPIANNMALIGDAAMTTDPIAGLGCSWALEAAKKLCHHTAPHIGISSQLNPALQAYADDFIQSYKAHYNFICKESLAKPLGRVAQFIYQQCCIKPELANYFLDYCGGLIGVNEFMEPFMALDEFKKR